MPRPVFIICARGSVQDKDSNLLSLYDVVEKLVLIPLPKITGQSVIVVQSQPFHSVSTWMLEPDKGDSHEDDYALEFRLLPPDGKEAVVLQSSKTRLGAADENFQRITLKIESLLPFTVSGLWEFEARIRKDGSDGWISQSYPLQIDIRDQA